MSSLYEYYSSTDCIISIGGIAAQEIFALQVGEQEQILPIYGWNDKFFHTIGSGNILITGTIIFNARYPNYLEKLIRGIQPVVRTNADGAAIPSNKVIASSIKQKVSNLIDTVVSTPSNTRRSADDLVELARLNDKYNNQYDDNKSESIDDYTSRSTMFDITIQGPYTIDKIQGCRLSSRAVEVNAGESNNIKSAQAFIARSMQQIKTS
jgi:hypothetical protein